MSNRTYDAVLFDLLSALLDSWSLWNAIAGSAELGRKWRADYLQITYREGAYRAYEDLVAEAGEAVGLGRGVAAELEARFGELQPWPEAAGVLRSLRASGIRLGVVTNCSERLGREAANCVGVEFDAVVTAERAGFYKPDPRTYRLALRELGADVARCLFVAGSGYDLVGTANVGLGTYWHNRVGLAAPEGAPPPLVEERTLEPLLRLAVK